MILLESPFVSIMVLVTVVVSGGLVLYAWRRHDRTASMTHRLVELALGGRSDEARIHARSASSEVAPVLEALSGTLEPPGVRPITSDLGLIILIALPISLLCIRGYLSLDAEGPTSVESTAAFLLGLGLILPVSVVAALAIAVFGRYSARTIRASSILLLARAAKSSYEHDIAEVLKKNTQRDPRGE